MLRAGARQHRGRPLTLLWLLAPRRRAGEGRNVPVPRNPTLLNDKSKLRILTLEEANALLPEISALVAVQLERRAAIERQLSELAKEVGAAPETVVEHPGDPPAVRMMKREVIAAVHTYQATWNELEAHGAVLKDARTGLVDFYSRIDGRVVFLCWRFGESTITHYHEIDAGYSGRRPLEGQVKNRLYN